MSVGIKTGFNVGKNQSKSSTTNGEIMAPKSHNALLKHNYGNSSESTVREVCEIPVLSA